jgi:hypothetical protein
MIYDGNGSTGLSYPKLLYAVKRIDSGQWGFGARVASVGDINGNGSVDIAISNPDYQVGGSWSSGAVYVYDPTSLSSVEASSTNDPTIHRLIGAPSSGQLLGSSIMMGSDYDTDGTQDNIMIGAPGAFAEHGAIRHFREISMAPQLPNTYAGTKLSQRFGTSLAPGVDFDADGSIDLIVASPYESYVYPEAGMVAILSGATGEVIKKFYGREANARLGIDVMYRNENLFVSTEKGSIYQISKSYLMDIQHLDEQDHAGNFLVPRLSGFGWNAARVSFTKKVEKVGDLPGDYSGNPIIHGTSQVGMYFNSTSHTYFGGAYIFSGSGIYGSQYVTSCYPGGPTGNSGADCSCFIGGSSDGDGFGASAAYVDDLTGDGLVDIAVGAPAASNAGGSIGKVYIFDGTQCQAKAVLTTTDAVFVISPNVDSTTAGSDRFGSTLLGLSDFDGNGPNNGTLLISNHSPLDTESARNGDLFAVTSTMKKARLDTPNFVFLARNSGAAGNSITVSIQGPPGYIDGTNIYAVSCSASGNDVTITLGKTTYSAPHLYGSAYDVGNAINANADCKALISVRYPLSGSGDPQIMAAANLSGGIDGSLILQSHIVESVGSVFGTNIISLGDLNRDNYPEIGVSVGRGRGIYGDGTGQVVVYSGKELIIGAGDPSFPSNAELIKFYSQTQEYSNFGSSMFNADLDADGLNDFAIGAPRFSTTNNEVGGVFIYKVLGLGSKGND